MPTPGVRRRRFAGLLSRLPGTTVATVGTLPLFPLGTVLFPGMVLPLHVFEPRYRQLVADLAERPPEQQSFGVVAIRAGREVGADAVSTLHEVGCVTQVTRIVPLPDGRFEIVTVGTTPFRLRSVSSTAAPYLVAEVDLLEETPAKPDDALLGMAVRERFTAYRSLLTDDAAELPVDPRSLSYLVSAAMLLDLHEQQRLLADRDTTRRLRTLLALLRREQVLLESLRAIPARDLAHAAASPN
jgi:hypothetical protein